MSSTKATKELRDGIISGKVNVEDACKQLTRAGAKALDPDGRAAKPGKMTAKEYADGMLRRKSNVTSAAKELREGAVKEAAKGEAKFESVGKSLASGLARGILSGVGKVISAAESIVEKGVAAAKKKADVNSPSKVMRDQVGLPLAEGLEVGMHKGAPQVASAAADMVNDTVDAANAAAAKAKIDTSKLTLSPAEAQAAIAANIDSMSAQAKLAVQYEMDRRAASVAVQAAAAPTYNDSQVVGLLDQLLAETKAGKVIRVNQRELGRTVQQWERRMSNVTGGM